ncbi:MAG: hypothetical protein PHY02_03160 [Phycisphaerae bacterium]|nr:hypothetical protein [Phycisphaerae bacterium]
MRETPVIKMTGLNGYGFRIKCGMTKRDCHGLPFDRLRAGGLAMTKWKSENGVKGMKGQSTSKDNPSAGRGAKQPPLQVTGLTERISRRF